MSTPGGKELDEHKLLVTDGGGKVLGGEVDNVRLGTDASHQGGGGKTDEGNSRGDTHVCIWSCVEEGRVRDEGWR